MVTRAQPGPDARLDVLRTINPERESCLAIGATIMTADRAAVGDESAAT